MSKKPTVRKKTIMTDADALVIADPEGNYYVVPREHLELSKVGEVAKDNVKQQLEQQKPHPEDLGGGFSFVGVIKLPKDANWRHYSPDIAWPH